LKKLTSSKALYSEVVHQKLTSSEVLKIIRSRKTGSFKGCSNVIITPIIAEEYKLEATANSEELKCIGCLFFG